MANTYDKKYSPFQIVLSLFFILIILAVLLPILNIVATSFSGREAIAMGKVGILPVDFTTSAYNMVFRDKSMLRSLAFSVFLMLVKTIVSMILTILAAYPLSKRNLPGNKAIMLMITITMYFNAGMIPNYLLIKQLKLINTFWVLVIPAAITPFNLIILRSFFMSINSSLFDAAYIDGCTEMQTLRMIAIPLSKAAILTLSLFYAVSRWNSVSDIILYVQNTNFYTLQYKLKLMLDTINIPYDEMDVSAREIVAENFKAACIVFTMIPVLVIYPFVQKYFRQGVMVGGVKE
ncbi:MAG: carbohydrate ABC transporter permease [Dorea formicigenerans]|nr:carbohydrate ABC transporter permease [Spirochaetales bacterium]MDD7519095.1 carbohydrate ABC transporter permease [Dorea formicigenerans]